MKLTFDWDKGNTFKSYLKHNIHPAETESSFYDKNKLIIDTYTKNNEIRSMCIGKSNFDRLISTTFTIRNEKIRPISSRKVNQKERYAYISRGI